jgi:hypothetical protein
MSSSKKHDGLHVPATCPMGCLDRLALVKLRPDHATAVRDHDDVYLLAERPGRMRMS